MIPDLKKSVDRILHERLTSPFWGAFIISWLVWNWRIPYVTLFVNEAKLEGTRIEYIVSAVNWKDSGLWPLLSAIVVILVVPLFTNGAYWVYIRYEQWKVDQKSQVDKKRRLTIEESVHLKDLVRTTEEKYDAQLNKKENQLRLLQAQINELQAQDTAEKEALIEKTIKFEKWRKLR